MIATIGGVRLYIGFTNRSEGGSFVQVSDKLRGAD